jgi:hypothetical protein
MFARKQTLCAAIPMDPPSQCLQEPLLEKSVSEKSTKMHQHEEMSLVVDGSPVLANIQFYSFLLGLMIGFFTESSALSAQVLISAAFGDDADMVTLLSIIFSCFASLTPFITLGFTRALVGLLYFLSSDPPEESKMIIIWHIECRIGLGTLIGVCSASLLMDSLLGMDGQIRYSAGILGGAMVLLLIFQFCFGNKHRQVMLSGSSIETKQVAPTSSSDNKHDRIDPTEMWCGGKVDSDGLLIV